jgi:hypothetical protein
LQIKADLIHKREADLLVPAAGPNASEILRLLRPAVRNKPTSERTAGYAAGSVIRTQLANAPNQSTAGIPMSELNSGDGDTPAAAETKSETASAAAVRLMGLSCAISAHGEVQSCPQPPTPPSVLK